MNAKPRVTFPAGGHHRLLTGTKLYCLVTEAHVCEQLAKGCYGWDSTPKVQRSNRYVTRPCTQWGLRGIMHESPHSTPRRELDGHKIPDAVIVRTQTQTQPTDCYTLPQSDGQLNKSKWQRSWHLDVGLNRFWVSLSENCATLEFWFTRFDLYQNLNFEVQNWSASYKHLMNGKAQRLTLPAAPLAACV